MRILAESQQTRKPLFRHPVRLSAKIGLRRGEQILNIETPVLPKKTGDSVVLHNSFREGRQQDTSQLFFGSTMQLDLPEEPLDEAFALTAALHADSHPHKVSLGAGVYRDEFGKPWILPSVEKVSTHRISFSTGHHR